MKKFDIFFSICQMEVDGVLPNERTMFENFFEQVRYADELGFETAWVAETHLSSTVQKENAHPVIPHFRGEIGLNTDILQLASAVFAQTRQIAVGSAVRNILCNGGPIAHAEALKTFLTLNQFIHPERVLNFGFASGRFEYSNRPYGIKPRSALEQAAWPAIKGKILLEATEIFLRLVKGECFERSDLSTHHLERSDFRSDGDWRRVRDLAPGLPENIVLEPFWNFEKIGVVPLQAPLHNLRLTLGSHDPRVQKLANQILPVGVFNLSITPPAVIEQTHERLAKEYHPDGGPWRRELMPRTEMIFLNSDSSAAKTQARHAWKSYWQAMEGTLDPGKVEQAVLNTLAGTPAEIVEAIQKKYKPADRLMLWFDFNTHDNAAVKRTMHSFMADVAPHLERPWNV